MRSSCRAKVLPAKRDFLGVEQPKCGEKTTVKNRNYKDWIGPCGPPTSTSGRWYEWTTLLVAQALDWRAEKKNILGPWTHWIALMKIAAPWRYRTTKTAGDTSPETLLLRGAGVADYHDDWRNIGSSRVDLISLFYKTKVIWVWHGLFLAMLNRISYIDLFVCRKTYIHHHTSKWKQY